MKLRVALDFDTGTHESTWLIRRLLKLLAKLPADVYVTRIRTAELPAD